MFRCNGILIAIAYGYRSMGPDLYSYASEHGVFLCGRPTNSMEGLLINGIIF
jgi:hypothetical protein